MAIASVVTLSRKPTHAEVGEASYTYFKLRTLHHNSMRKDCCVCSTEGIKQIRETMRNKLNISDISGLGTCKKLNQLIIELLSMAQMSGVYCTPSRFTSLWEGRTSTSKRAKFWRKCCANPSKCGNAAKLRSFSDLGCFQTAARCLRPFHHPSHGPSLPPLSLLLGQQKSHKLQGKVSHCC